MRIGKRLFTADEPMTAVVVGIGAQGRRVHIQRAMAHPDTRLVGVVDDHPGRANEFAQQLGVRGFTDYREAFRQTMPDVVVIATHAASHADIAEAAEQHGVKVVLCEKPVAESVANAQRIAALMERGLQVEFGFKYQHAIPPAILSFIADGGLGVIHKVEARWWRRDGAPDWDDEVRFSLAGRGAWLDLAPHVGTVALTLAGFPAIRSAHGQALSLDDRGELVTWNPDESFDYWTTIGFGLEAGATLSIDVAWRCPLATRDEEVVVRAIGSRGAFTLPLPILESSAAEMEPKLELWTPGDDAPDLTGWKPSDDGTLYDLQWDHVVDVARGRVEPLVDAEAGVLTQQFLDLGYEAAAGRDVIVRN